MADLWVGHFQIFFWLDYTCQNFSIDELNILQIQSWDSTYRLVLGALNLYDHFVTLKKGCSIAEGFHFLHCPRDESYVIENLFRCSRISRAVLFPHSFFISMVCIVLCTELNPRKESKRRDKGWDRKRTVMDIKRIDKEWIDT